MVIATIILTIIAAICIAIHYERKLKIEKSKISFKEAIDLVNLPIVTFHNNDNSFNFLLDTGSSDSHISLSASSNIKGDLYESKINVVGYGNSKEVTRAIKANLEYKNKEYECMLLVSQGLDSAFDDIKSEYGVNLHGILGNDFLQKHKYILDFAELIAYNK